MIKQQTETLHNFFQIINYSEKRSLSSETTKSNMISMTNEKNKKIKFLLLKLIFKTISCSIFLIDFMQGFLENKNFLVTW